MKRKTSQREAIFNCLEESRRPMSPEEILDSARSRVPGLGIATVYRNVRRMLDEGQLIPVNLPDEPSRYELPGKGHHHHFRCRNCHRVYDIEGCPGALEMLVPAGFQLESHEIILFGLCKTCN